MRENHRKRMSKDMLSGKINKLRRWQGITGKDHISAKSVLQIDRINEKIIKEYGSISDALKENGWKSANISMCLTGKNPTAYGYKWKYKNNNDNAKNGRNYPSG